MSANQVLTSGDERDPRLLAATQALVNKTREFVTGKPLTENLMLEVNGLIVWHRRQMRNRGVDFPELTCILIPRLGYLKLVRKDLDLRGVQATVLNITVDCPGVQPDDIAKAIRYAFPWCKPGMLVDVETTLKPIHHSVEL